MISDSLIVFSQIAVIWCIFFFVLAFCSLRDRRFPLDDIGVFWILAFTLVVTLPSVNWLLQGGQFGEHNSRLHSLQIRPDAVIGVLTISLAYTCSFAASYIAIGRFALRPSMLGFGSVARSYMWASVIVYVISWAIAVWLHWSGAIRPAESYIDGYRALAEASLPVRQLAKILSGFQGVALAVILVGAVQRLKNDKTWFFLYCIIMLFTIDLAGSRAGFVKTILGIAVAWHILIRPISLWLAVLGLTLGILAFLVLGELREHQAVLSGFGNLSFGEFDALFANSAELLAAKSHVGFAMPWTAQFGEFFAFIPSQLLWFEKSSASIWFLEQFHSSYMDEGGGLAFGAIAQVIVGAGLFEAVIRGIFLGIIAGRIMNWIRNSGCVWWRGPCFIWLFLCVYQTIRNTTFAPFSDIVQELIPGLLLIYSLSVGLRKFTLRHVPAR